MDTFLFSANCVLPLLLLMVVGYVLRLLGVVSESFVKQANQFCFKVTLPVQLFGNIYKQDLTHLAEGRLIAFTVLAILAVVALLWLLLPRLEKDGPACAAEIQGIFRGNFLIFGLPLAINMFGEEGAFPTALLLPVAIPVYNVLAVITLARFSGSGEKVQPKKVLLNIAKNSLVIASVLGIAVSLTGIPLPTFVTKSVDTVGAAATPMALMMLGAQFDFSKLKGNLRKGLLCTAARLIIVPLAVMSLAIALGFRGPHLGAIFILFCAPTAVSSYVMAQNMGADSDLAGQLVVLTTLFSSLTLFLQTALLRGMGWI